MEFEIGGRVIRVNLPNWATMEARVSERLAQRKGFALATINLDHLVKLRSSEAFREAYAAQDFVTADGNPIIWMARMAGRPVSLIPGSDAILPLARIAARQGAPIALVGSTDDTLRAAAGFLQSEVRGLEVACCVSPPMGFDPSGAEAERILAQVAASGARMCFVALGAPKQEVFAATGRRVTPEIGFVSIGAGLDFFAGSQKRAPAWVRKFQVEWLWRLLSSPKRLAPRYALCATILPGQMLRAVMIRFRTGRA
ncbi:WecB/TagA/CpsF family glycosyltransferase [Cognatishimia sp. F0-27]|uniref:WecB/TagA/CpsF family glycosyltransferase n=1 Tax=Cognatishimia sp. F0-27 TaxID=2816855 RepID=UPI001D0C8C88|nr:WecB/TagA/CpsF family glycosyltransferase [Cognatishimia sp. F0-27]MCC1491146.1 WecB/TagA/CpsF family glycosyltransferase [Cognatishimia sp. F0-27]